MKEEGIFNCYKSVHHNDNSLTLKAMGYMSVLVKVMTSKDSLPPFSATKVNSSAGLMVSSRPAKELASDAEEFLLWRATRGDVRRFA